MFQDLLNGYFTVESISSASTQIFIVALLTQYIKSFLQASNVKDKWFPIVGLAVGEVTQVLLFFALQGITLDSFCLGSFHGLFYGSLGIAAFDISKAIKEVTLPKDTQNKLEETKALETAKIEDKNSRKEQQEFENWAHH